MVKKINKSIGVFFPLFYFCFCFIGLFFLLGCLMVGGGDSLVWISSSELTENIGETWGSFFLPFSIFLSLIIFLFNLLLVSIFLF